MNKLFTDRFMTLTITVRDGISVVYADYFTETERMDKEGYKNHIHILREKIIESKAHAFISDTENFRFPISPDMQLWSVSHFVKPLQDAGVKKVAIMMPDEFIANLAVEQSIDEANEVGLLTRYFSNTQEAENWIFS